jgi:hypothetical protein
VADPYAPRSRAGAPRGGARPVYLVVALVLVWLLGLFGWWDGFRLLDILHRPDLALATLDQVKDAELARKQAALINTMVAFRKTLIPLATAQFLLGALLTLASGIILFGRKQARSLLLQAMFAYAAFLSVDYVLQTPVRAVTMNPDLPALSGPRAVMALDTLRNVWQWVFRAVLGLQLGVLAMAFIAVTRRRARLLFAGPSPRDVGQEGP